MANPLTRTARRLAMALGVGRTTANTNETSSTATVQVLLPGGELLGEVPLIQQVGFHSRPLPGSDVVVQSQAGDRQRSVAVATGDQRAYPKDLQPGDACLYHAKTGARVWLKADGSIAVSTLGPLHFSAIEAVFDCPITCTKDIAATGDVKAGAISLTKHKHPVSAAPGTTDAPE
ncbi:phage baseplate assembly protein [Acetobacter orientalis]|uniref:phage baseplate assembly protein domain-containing protein n=1 Tax=Acetobacter orientalis TaxID=146474 RepID=UPI0039EB3FBA